MRWHASSSSSTFPSSSIVLFFRSSPFWFRFSLSHSLRHTDAQHTLACEHTRTGFSSRFGDCQILYPILTAINDKRYDAAIKPSRLHITVAIKTMILSTTSIFIVVIVIVRVWFLYSSVVAGRFSSIPLLLPLLALRLLLLCRDRESLASVCANVHDTQQQEMGTVYLLVDGYLNPVTISLYTRLFAQLFTRLPVCTGFPCSFQRNTSFTSTRA